MSYDSAWSVILRDLWFYTICVSARSVILHDLWFCMICDFCMINVSVWSVILHDRWFCIIYDSACSMILHDMWFCTIYDSAWSVIFAWLMFLYDLWFCVIYASVWSVILHDLWFCMTYDLCTIYDYARSIIISNLWFSMRCNDSRQSMNLNNLCLVQALLFYHHIGYDSGYTSFCSCPTNTPAMKMLKQTYYLQNRTRIQPCSQSRSDPYRIVLYDMAIAAEHTGTTVPLLLRRHNITPGMFLVGWSFSS